MPNLRLRRIEEQKYEIQRKKEENAVKREQRLQRQRKDLLSDLQKKGGLWNSVQEFEKELETTPDRQKLGMLKTQIKARKTLLNQNADSSLFAFSKKGKAFKIEELKPI